MNEMIKVFESEEFGSVRTVSINGEPWLVGKDVATILGYERPTKAIQDHVDDEDKDGIPIQDSIGRMQKTPIINESGFYSLVLASKLPSAKRFKRWVTSEVLPSIRKTGSYSTSKTKDDYILQVAYADTIAERAIALNELNNNIIKPLEEKVEEQSKEIEYKEDVIIGLVDDISLAQKRQILNRVVRYGHANYQQRWSILYREFENKYHIDLNRRVQSYNKKNSPKVKSKLDYIDKVMNKIPELYELAAKLFENDVNELISEMYGVTNTEMTLVSHSEKRF